MKESRKILLYGMLAFILLIFLCLYTHQDEFINKEKISSIESSEEAIKPIADNVDRVEIPSATVVSKVIDKQENRVQERREAPIREDDSKEAEERNISTELNESDTKETATDRASFRDKDHIQLKERPKVEKVEKIPEVSDKNLPIEDNKPLIDNEKKREPKSHPQKNNTVKKEHKPVSISSVQSKISSIANRNISFYKGKAQITNKGKNTLNKLIPLLKKVPHAKIIVKGYTDASGKESVNLWISQERAKSVKRYLGKHGIPLKNIVSKGYGESELLYGDKPYSKLNRRVEIELKKGK